MALGEKLQFLLPYLLRLGFLSTGIALKKPVVQWTSVVLKLLSLSLYTFANKKDLGKLLIILNPKSGTSSNKSLRVRFEKYLNHTGIPFQMKLTEKSGHGTELAREGIAAGYEKIIAVGGDGTINEVATALIGTNVALGIVPRGSGNGLARHLKIPLAPMPALKKALNSTSQAIDVCYLNNRPFFCTAGIGFDGQVTHRFASLPGRGLPNYVKASFQEYWVFKPQMISVNIGETEISKPAFSLTLANANQFGNNARVAPLADIQDGLMDLVWVKAMPWWRLPDMGFSLFSGLFHKSPGVKTVKTSKVTVAEPSRLMVHLDGEPVSITGNLHFEIAPGKLRVLA